MVRFLIGDGGFFHLSPSGKLLGVVQRNGGDVGPTDRSTFLRSQLRNEGLILVILCIPETDRIDLGELRRQRVRLIRRRARRHMIRLGKIENRFAKCPSLEHVAILNGVNRLNQSVPVLYDLPARFLVGSLENEQEGPAIHNKVIGGSKFFLIDLIVCAIDCINGELTGCEGRAGGGHRSALYFFAIVVQNELVTFQLRVRDGDFNRLGKGMDLISFLVGEDDVYLIRGDDILRLRALTLRRRLRAESLAHGGLRLDLRGTGEDDIFGDTLNGNAFNGDFLRHGLFGGSLFLYRGLFGDGLFDSGVFDSGLLNHGLLDGLFLGDGLLDGGLLNHGLLDGFLGRLLSRSFLGRLGLDGFLSGFLLDDGLLGGLLLDDGLLSGLLLDDGLLGGLLLDDGLLSGFLLDDGLLGGLFLDDGLLGGLLLDDGLLGGLLLDDGLLGHGLLSRLLGDGLLGDGLLGGRLLSRPFLNELQVHIHGLAFRQIFFRDFQRIFDGLEVTAGHNVKICTGNQLILVQRFLGLHDALTADICIQRDKRIGSGRIDMEDDLHQRVGIDGGCSGLLSGSGLLSRLLGGSGLLGGFLGRKSFFIIINRRYFLALLSGSSFLGGSGFLGRRGLGGCLSLRFGLGLRLLYALLRLGFNQRGGFRRSRFFRAVGRKSGDGAQGQNHQNAEQQRDRSFHFFSSLSTLVDTVVHYKSFIFTAEAVSRVTPPGESPACSTPSADRPPKMWANMLPLLLGGEEEPLFAFSPCRHYQQTHFTSTAIEKLVKNTLCFVQCSLLHPISSTYQPSKIWTDKPLLLRHALHRSLLATTH